MREIRQWLEAARGGDPEAGERLSAWARDVLYSVCRRHVRHRWIDADDLAQDAFLKLLQGNVLSLGLEKLEVDRPEAVKALLIKTASCTVATWLRRKHTQKRGAGRVTLPTGTNKGETDPQAPDPPKTEAKESLLSAMTRLSERERRVVELRYQGLKRREIAVELDIKPEAVSEAWKEARRKLFSQLKETHDDR